MKQIIKDLQNYRLEHRLSQALLAKKLGVTWLTVQKWLSGKMIPRQMHEYHIKKLITQQSGETKEEVIDQDFIKRHTKNGIFIHASNSWEEHDKVNLEYDRSRSGEEKVAAALKLKDLYYKIKGIEIKPIDRTKISLVTQDDINKEQKKIIYEYKQGLH